MELTPSVARKIADDARAMHTESDTAATLRRAVERAVEFIAGAEDGGISLLHRRDGTVETPAVTSERAGHVDRIQSAPGPTPYHSALEETEAILVSDLLADDRWGTWARDLAESSGIRSMLCLRLFTNEQLLGALTLYSSVPNAFTSEDVDNAQAFAAHAALAVANARAEANFVHAMDARSRVGHAVGIVMERFDLDVERAFEVLLRLSQQSNRKLRDIAAELVTTRRLPSDD